MKLETLLGEVCRAGFDAQRTAETLLRFASEIGGYVSFGDAAASIRVRNAQTRRPCTLFVVTRKATFYIGFLGRWEENAGVGPDLALGYDRELTQILGKSPRMTSRDKSGKLAPTLTDIARHLDEVLAAVRSRAKLLRAAEPAGIE